MVAWVGMIASASWVHAETAVTIYCDLDPRQTATAKGQVMVAPIDPQPVFGGLERADRTVIAPIHPNQAHDFTGLGPEEQDTAVSVV